MDRIPEDKYFKFKPDTMLFMRKQYSLDKPGQMDEAIDNLDAWLKKQPHLVKKEFSRDYLERIIIMFKGSVERAKNQIERLCTLRTLLPQFFEKLDAKSDYKFMRDLHTTTYLPYLTESHHRIYFMRLEPGQYFPKFFTHILYYNILILEYLKAHDYSNGLITITDFTKVTNLFDFATQINLTELRQMSTINLKGFGTRTKKFILISSSNAIEIIVKILKQILPEKLAKRMVVISDTKELKDHVSGDLLPSDYGGDLKPLAELRDDFEEVLASKENIEYLKEMSKARTDESRRVKLEMNEDFSGISGSFRTLSID